MHDNCAHAHACRNAASVLTTPHQVFELAETTVLQVARRQFQQLQQKYLNSCGRTLRSLQYSVSPQPGAGVQALKTVQAVLVLKGSYPVCCY